MKKNCCRDHTSGEKHHPDASGQCDHSSFSYEEEKRLCGAGGEGGQERGKKAVEDLRRWSEEMEVRGQWKEAASWMGGGGNFGKDE